MNLRYICFVCASLALALFSSPASAQKKALSHDDFDAWNRVANLAVSRDGAWSAFSIRPQEGDDMLTLYNTRTGKRVNIERGYKVTISADSRWAIAQIKAPFAVTRQAKIDKKKDMDLPQDSLAIVDLRTLKVTKIADVTDYKLAKDAGSWVAFRSCDTSLITPKQLKDKEAGRPLVLLNLENRVRKVTRWVKDYSFSRDGSKLAINIRKPEKDSIATDGIGVFALPDTSYTIIDRDRRFYSAPVFDEAGSRLAYTASDDSVKSGTKRASIYLSNLQNTLTSPREINLNFKNEKDGELVPNQYTKLSFSHDGRRLIAGVAPIIAPDDTTIVDFEHGKLDIWVWNKPFNPPMEENLLKQIRECSYPVAIDMESLKPTLISDCFYGDVEAPNRWDGDYALVTNPADKIVSYQWDYFAPVRMELVNVNTGENKYIGDCLRATGASLSPLGKYVVWFRDRNYYVYDTATGKSACVSEKVPYPLWDVDDRHPSPAENYGIAGWTEGDADLLVYDKHDIWVLDPKGVKEPVCLTAGDGRKRDLRYRYRNTDREDHRNIASGDRLLLNVFSYADKRQGLAFLKYGAPKAPDLVVLDTYEFSQILKAKNKDVFSWQRANFSTSPDIWLADGLNLNKAKKLTDANPQMKDYRWGTAHLERWYAYDGSLSEGVLYVPDDLDPNKKYPMLCVFYETGSEDLYHHYTMEPSWSWVNYPFYVSRGYVVFVPDIHYNSGRPGEDAYNYVCSGAEEMCRRYPWIDKDHIGIDGQSWGGYQTAFLITRTNMFACAGSGAPVANMTSAYGGIRWESGDSRQAQYEQGQSRIGGTLWEKTPQYIANSPIFFADRVNTPLLIMHNDADGAVPWYQGIELFMGLRRLEKPVWMLQYNGEAHNIKARQNRKDITRRLQQFFDHYLKGDPMPKWMKEGVPMIRKGQEWGFEVE